ncbi:MAG: hypothetical protein FGM58_08835 [Acidimicrobiia bacterium]|nr:hypothetical protein [Acidimicrobiia bacterium]
MDWAVGAADGWHLASTDAAVRQWLVEDTPVVVSALRVPDGAIEHRCWAGVVAGRPFAMIELHNAAPVAVAVAVVIRPSADRHLGSIGLDDAEVRVDGRRTLWFTRAPSRSMVGTTAAVLDAIASGTADGRWPVDGVRSADGDAAAAFVFPLPHTASMRMALALDDVPDGVPVDVASMVASDVVVSGWRTQTAGAPRIDLPERDAASAIDAARRHLLVHAGLRLRAGVDDDATGLAAEMAMALDEHGLHVTARDLLGAALATRRSDGSFGAGDTITTARVLVALDRHRRLADDGPMDDELVAIMAAGADRLRRRVLGSRWPRAARPSRVGRLRADAADARWTLQALQSAAASLRASGQTDAAAVVDGHAMSLRREVPDRAGAGHDGAGRAMGDVVTGLRRRLAEGVPCWTWPSTELGDDPWRAVEFLRSVRALLVDDDGDGIDLLPDAIDEWFGSPLAVHDLPTAHGRVSFALRWHGARPAMLWDLALRDDAAPVRVSASMLDPAWMSTDPRSEALLAEPHHEHRSFT